jgi:hypothetical protein
LIRTIVLHGGRKYTAGIIDRTKYKRLVDLGWLTRFNVNSSDVEYVATDLGRTAAKPSRRSRNGQLIDENGQRVDRAGAQDACPGASTSTPTRRCFVQRVANHLDVDLVRRRSVLASPHLAPATNTFDLSIESDVRGIPLLFSWDLRVGLH